MFTTANGDRPGVQNIAIVVTDGHSADRFSTLQEAAALHRDQVTVLGLGVTVRSAYDRYSPIILL